MTKRSAQALYALIQKASWVLREAEAIAPGSVRLKVAM
jgi:hypothetical protein